VSSRGEHNAWLTADRMARGGLVARAVFYAVLAYLVARVAATGGASHHQADTAGALALITESLLGRIAVGVAAVGFFVLGAVRLAGAIRDRRPKWWQRASTGLQGAFYLALSYVPVSFLLGNRKTGSEQAQHQETATLLRLPAGAALVVALGVLVICVSAWQIRTALSQDYLSGLRMPSSAAGRAVVRVSGTAGIAARALVFLPIGGFLIASGVQHDPAHSKGLDGELADLARHWWGIPALVAVVVGLLVFTTYSLVEARYRNVEAGG
jgi:type IV secretory pathway VirB2 component (pilin)